MFKNYLKIAVRNILKHKSYSLINIFGLGVGFACYILVVLFVQHEISYDKFHEKGDRINRVVAEFNDDDGIDNFAHTPAPLGPSMVDEFPEVINKVRIRDIGEQLLFHKDKLFWDFHCMYADESIFNVFSFQLIKGNPESALKEPNSIVITETVAKSFFEDENPVGKNLTIGNYRAQFFKEMLLDKYNKRTYTIAGVIKDIPSYSQLQFDCLLPFSNIKRAIGWGNWNYDTYILLSGKNQSPELESKLNGFIKKHWNNDVTLHLQPLTRIHLHSRLRSDLETNTDIAYIYFSLIIAGLLLILACINFINIETARSSTRHKEVALRKAAGAQRFQLIKQFLVESVIISLLAFLFSLILVEVMFPSFNSFISRELNLDYIKNFVLIVFLLASALLVGIAAGMYPAYIISAYQPEETLKSRFIQKKSNYAVILRSALVVLQFSISIIFLVCTFIIKNQMSYISNKDLGYYKKNIVIVSTHEIFPIFQYENCISKLKAYKSEIMQNTYIKGASFEDNMFNRSSWRMGIWWEGLQDEYAMMDWIYVGYDFIDILGIEMKEGRNFSEQFAGDRRNAYILNESAVKKIGWDNPIGKKFGNQEGKVIGVVKDFHYKPLHQDVQPLVIKLQTKYTRMLIKMESQNIHDTLEFLKGKWNEFFPGQPFKYSFFDEDYNRIYENEARIGRVFNTVSILVVLIACLGLLGLASFSTVRRTKEIGIRKVLGATVPGIIYMLSKEFLKWVVIANIIAWPIAYYFMNKWLQNFAYRIDMSWWIFALAGLLALVIALLTVSFQAVKAARANPVEALRYE